MEGSSKSICVRRFSPSALSLFRFHLSPFPPETPDTQAKQGVKGERGNRVNRENKGNRGQGELGKLREQGEQGENQCTCKNVIAVSNSLKEKLFECSGPRNA